ncbi:MAG: gephyrin-like molybdotransferase Glp [Gemmatimonadota bacterium]
MTRPPDWLGVEDALARMLERCDPLPPETVPLTEAGGRALAADLVARVDHPPWDNAAMDGFAVRADDVAGATKDRPVRLPVAADVPAGARPAGPLAPGTAVRVMTGAPVPEGATGVVRIEHTDGGREGRVAILDASDAARNIRLRGEDVRAGTPLLGAGDEVTPAVTGLLAMNGFAEVRVGRRPRIGVLSNGDELADLDGVEDVLAGRKIMNSNGYALADLVRTAGGEPVPLGIALDTAASVREKLRLAADCDGVISSAGVSVGDRDEVKGALREAGMETLFWRVRMRPGSPLTFGVLDGHPVWGLPGNPVSALVTFEVFLRPAIRRMAGHRRLRRRRMPAVVGEPIESSAGLTHFFRVRLEEREGRPPVAHLTGPQGSGLLTSLVLADALLVVPEGVERIEPDDGVSVLPLRP